MKKLICLLLSLLAVNPVFALSFSSGGEYKDEGMKLYISGTIKLQEGDLSTALADLSKSVKLRPDMAEAFHNLGFAYEKSGDYKNAIRAYERALHLKPSYPSALNNLGFILASTGSDVAQGIMLCQKAVELNPKSAAFRDSLGWALYKGNRNQEAAFQFQHALRLDPTFGKSYFNLGLMEYMNKNYSAAINYFQQAIKHDPEHAKSYISLADSMEKTGNLSQALHYYRQADVKTPASDPIKRHLETKVKQLSRDSKQQYFTALNQNVKKGYGSAKMQSFINKRNSTKTPSNTSFTPVNIASYNMQNSSANAANQALANKQAIAARNAKDTNKIARSYDYTSTYVNTPSQISISQERELERKYSLAKSYLDRGLVNDAANELNFILNMAPETSMVGRQSRTLMLRVKKILEQKQEEKASKHLDLGKDFFRSGQYQLAEMEYNKALAKDPENAEIYKDLALLNYNRGSFDAAYEHTKRAIALDRTQKEAYVVLASLYAQKGRNEEAVQALRRVKEVSKNKDAVDELAERMLSSLSVSAGY
ncbi:MAG: tetratricopeptide repeat protein [Candidatus Riflebacteria bacterium]|nr:tetratricopeptide repeat protein [Candidatus Riflebacteria bacterium]